MDNTAKPARLKAILTSSRGFTLIELLFAVMVFLVGIVSVVWVVSQSLQDSRELHMRMSATYLAQHKAEELRNSDYYTLVSGQDLDDEGFPILLDSYGNPGGIYSRSWVVEDDTPIVGTKTITVYVSWTEAEAESISIVTVVGQPYPEGMM